MTMLVFVVACSEEDPVLPDGGATGLDAEVEDVQDAGILAKCPVDPNAACAQANQCGMDDRTTSQCPGCVPYNYAMCETARCETRDRLGGGDVYTLLLPVSPAIQAKSFTGHIIGTTTSGGNTLTCADVYAAGWSLIEPCYNVIDSRRYGENAQVGEVYRLPFTQFIGGIHALFVVHAYDAEGAQGTRVGISCTEWDIGTPGVGPTDVPGDTMRVL